MGEEKEAVDGSALLQTERDPSLANASSPVTAENLRLALVTEINVHLTDIVKYIQDGDLLNEEQEQQLEDCFSPAQRSTHTNVADIQEQDDGSFEKQESAEADQEENSEPSDPIDKDMSVERFVSYCVSSSEVAEIVQRVLEDMELNKALVALQTYQQCYQVEDDKEQLKEAQAQPVKCPPRSYKEVLRSSTGTFIDTLKLDHTLLQLLEKSFVLNSDMVRKVMCRPNRRDKIRELMSLMMELGPESVDAFVGALRTTQQHFLANILAANDYI